MSKYCKQEISIKMQKNTKMIMWKNLNLNKISHFQKFLSKAIDCAKKNFEEIWRKNFLAIVNLF